MPTRRYAYSYTYIQERAHNILWSFSPCNASTDPDAAFSSWYPGDDTVDVIAIDRYNPDRFELETELRSDCAALVDYAGAHFKVAAFGELGIMGGVQDIKDSTFFTDSILSPLEDCWRNLSFIMFYA